MTQENLSKDLSKQNDLNNNFVVSKLLLEDIYAYLNSRPRSETNSYCLALEGTPSVTDFQKKLDEFYNKE